MAFNILVVDDSKLVHSVIAKTLEMAEVPVKQLHFAENGEIGLEQLAEHPIDLVFSDLHMPVMNGMEMIERMQANEHLKSIPIIVISSEGSKTRLKHLKEEGVKAIIRKPFTPESVRNVVFEVMGIKDEQ
jgi:two-component system chemotaxis response regulator CheY